MSDVAMTVLIYTVGDILWSEVIWISYYIVLKAVPNSTNLTGF